MFNLEFWIILSIIFILSELLTTNFVLLSFGISSAITALLEYFKFDLTIQVIAFILISIVLILASRPFYKKITEKSSSKKSNVDRLIGKEVKVVEKITKENPGMVVYFGDYWKAESNENFKIGEYAIVKEIKGARLIVRKK